MRSLAAAVVLAASLLTLAPNAAPAQSIVVEVTAAESGAPLVGAFVALLDAEGEIVRRALADGEGRAVLPTGGAGGTFRVRAELIGRETATSAPVTLAADGGSATVSLALVSHAISLGELRVEVDDRCRIRPDEATELQRVWDEARKVIALQAWAEDEGLYALEISTYDRDLDAGGRRVERENRRGTSVVSRIPFTSLPPEELLSGGFARPLDGGGYEYFAPDAGVLLSDLFLHTHCFRLARSAEQPGDIGLAFEPVEAGERTGIRGTFWLDEETAALRHIEYRYTQSPYPEADGIAGGRVAFDALPDGVWIIARWTIRAPLLARRHVLARGGASGIRVVGIRETGGEVLSVSALDRQLVSRAERGSVRGVVWDSTASAPLAGARVRLSGTAYAGETNDEGRFRLDELPAGLFIATFSHPRMDSLGVSPPGVEAEVVAGRTLDLALGVPSRETILLATCRAGESTSAVAEEGAVTPADGARHGGVLSGVVRTGAGGEPVPGARVRVEWHEIDRLDPSRPPRSRQIEVGADEEGRYTVCGVPMGEAVRAQAHFLNVRGAAAEATVGGRGHLVVDLEVDFGSESFASDDLTAEGGVQGIQGRLVEQESGRPVRTAEVILRSDSGTVLASGTTDEDGWFRLRVQRSGDILFSARALGYGPVEDHEVEVLPGQLTVVEVQVATEAFELEPIVVTAERRSFHLEREGFYRRRQQGFGVYMTPEFIERRAPQKVSDLLFGVPGVRVSDSQTGVGGRYIYFRGGDRFVGICWPMVYVNRHLVSIGGFAPPGLEGQLIAAAIDELVSAPDVLAIEVFRSPAEVPPEFNGPNAGCGVVVLWTRRGGGG